jgi:hypothetical protein
MVCDPDRYDGEMEAVAEKLPLLGGWAGKGAARNDPHLTPSHTSPGTAVIQISIQEASRTNRRVVGAQKFVVLL